MAFSEPQKNIQQFGIQEGWIVADLGCGPGYYVLATASRVGENGRVYAIDIQKELLKKVNSEAKDKALTNVEIIWGDIEKERGTKLADNSVHAAIIANTLFLVENKEACAKEAYRIVRSNGRVLIVDWVDSFGGAGPMPTHIVKEEDMRTIFENVGFSFEENIDAGSHHWGIIMRKK